MTHSQRVVIAAAAPNHERRSARVFHVALHLVKAGEGMSVDVPVEVVENFLTKAGPLGESKASRGAGGGCFGCELLQ